MSLGCVLNFTQITKFNQGRGLRSQIIDESDQFLNKLRKEQASEPLVLISDCSTCCSTWCWRPGQCIASAWLLPRIGRRWTGRMLQSFPLCCSGCSTTKSGLAWLDFRPLAARTGSLTRASSLSRWTGRGTGLLSSSASSLFCGFASPDDLTRGACD